MATTLKNTQTNYAPSKWETVPCPFCKTTGSKEFEKFGPNNSFKYVECSNCGLVYLNPRPIYDEKFVNIAYEDYDVDSHFFKSGGKVSEEELELVDQHNLILAQIEKALGRKKGKLLEIGCMTGLFLKTAKERGWDVVGIDISKKMVDHINNNLKIKGYCDQYQNVKFPAHEFDVIYCSHVIEHIPNPNEWMEKFRKDMKQDGLLCINVPNQNSIDRVLKRFVVKNIVDKRKWEGWRTPDHLFEPTARPMKYILKEHNFNVIDHFTYSRHEAKRSSFLSRLFHNKLRLGSKLRFFARPFRGENK
ncbi:MAG: methyltransferase domain-containing protein [bacterium]